MFTLLFVVGSYIVQFAVAYLITYLWNQFGVPLLGIPPVTVWTFLLIGYTWDTFLSVWRTLLYRSVGLKETVVRK